MANGTENIENKLPPQEEIEISKILDKITFNCPHCSKEINETHLDEKGRYFQSIKEKIRRTTEEELSSQKALQKKQLLEQIEIERSYEKFGEVIIKDRTIEELKKTTKKQEEEILELKLKSKEELARATSYDEIRKLEGFKELEQKVDKYQKEIEELKVGNQPEIQTLKLTIKKLEEDIAKEKLDKVKELKEQLVKFQAEKEEKDKQLSEANSTAYIEKHKRVRDLVEEVDKLRNENQLLRDQGRMSKRKGENLEKYVLEKLQETYNGFDEISKITHLGEKADIIHEISKDDQPIAKIIYEIKNDDKWNPKWLDKVEKDMINERADYGIIVASCQAGKPLWKPFPQKNILVSDEENFIFASQVARMLIFFKPKSSQGENAEERIKKWEEWVKEKLPNYLLRLGKGFTEWEKDIMKINTSVKNMGRVREEIMKIIISEIELELRRI